MHMWVGGVELFVYLVTCLTKVQMESCLRGFFYLFFFKFASYLYESYTSWNYNYSHV
jgi:hypothetical protein